MGFYSMTGGIGNTLAPVLLGAIGAAWGLASVFVVSGVLLAMGMCAMCWIWWRRPGPSYGLG
jgi:predicted MFS family arabinose efflux permease